MDVGNPQQDPLAQDLIRRILDHQGDKLLTEIRLADLVSYSVTHIRRVFYAAMGESLGDFMRRDSLNWTSTDWGAKQSQTIWEVGTFYCALAGRKGPP